MLDRRTFLHQVGAAASAAGLVTRAPKGIDWSTPVSHIFPEPDVAVLRSLALAAIDAARAAGAAFADVRLAVTRSANAGVYFTRGEGDPMLVAPWASYRTGYGIRAIVDGSWGFASGGALTPEAVARVAQAAVHAARVNKRVHPKALELAPAPEGTTGTWETPIEQDPLAVSLVEQGRFALDVAQAVVEMPQITKVEISFDWRRPVSVFAATDGRVFVQRLTMGQPSVAITASVGPGVLDQVRIGVDTLPLGGYGYEAVHPATLKAEVRDTAKRAIELAQAARTATSADVGRYDIVFGAGATAGLLHATLLPALNLPQALGYFADQGTSFAAPPADILGRFQIGSPLLTLSGDRNRPHGAASAKWDEEGIPTEPYTFVKDGTVVDYHTNRETAVELADWYRQRGEPVRSHGCTRRLGDVLPTVQTPNITLRPGAAAASVDDLIADTARGLYVEGAGGGSDQQFVTAQCSAEHFMVREIRRGKLRGYVKDFAFQFMTVPFWKSVNGIGGPSSAKVVPVTTDMAEQLDPLQAFPTSTFEMVPIRAPKINVINTGRTA